jgi:hypothetical protein
MFGAILLLFLSKILIVKQFLVYLINAATSIMLWVARITNDPGYGFIDFISFSAFDMLCCSFLLISFLVFIAQKQYMQVLAFCMIALVWLAGSVFTRYQDLNRNELLVFHVKNKSVFALRSGQQVYAHLGELSDKEFQRSVKPYLLQIAGLRLINTSANLLKCKSHTFLNVKQSGQNLVDLKPDYILVSNDAELQLTINYKTRPLIIADCSNSYKFVKKLRKECGRLGIPFYSIKEQGALKLKI